MWLIPMASRRLGSEAGQDLAEYGLLLGFVAVAVVGAVSLLGSNLNGYWVYLVGLWPF